MPKTVTAFSPKRRVFASLTLSSWFFHWPWTLSYLNMYVCNYDNRLKFAEGNTTIYTYLSTNFGMGSALLYTLKSNRDNLWQKTTWHTHASISWIHIQTRVESYLITLWVKIGSTKHLTSNIPFNHTHSKNTNSFHISTDPLKTLPKLLHHIHSSDRWITNSNRI